MKKNQLYNLIGARMLFIPISIMCILAILTCIKELGVMIILGVIGMYFWIKIALYLVNKE
jgi:hypothetical protein